MRKFVLIITLLLISFSHKAYAVPVLADLSSPTDLGLFTSGTYQIDASGIVSLAGPVSNTPNFDLHPNGVPVTGVTFNNYLYFNPNGSDTADGSYGPGGPGINIGAVMGTLSASPTTGDWFQIGFGTTISLNASQHVYAMVNDTYFPNNTGFFDVTVSAVPEPSILALFGFGLAGLGFVRRRFKN